MWLYWIQSIVREYQSLFPFARLFSLGTVPYYSQQTNNALWKYNACGMACLQMVLAYRQLKVPALITLATQCTQYGGYILKEQEVQGLYYIPFCQFVKKEFALSATVAPFLSIRRICFETSKRNMVIASVHNSIRDKSYTPPKNRGGHLVIITGYNREKQTISINNPSGIPGKSQKKYKLSFEEFKKFFAGRGIIVGLPLR